MYTYVYIYIYMYTHAHAQDSLYNKCVRATTWYSWKFVELVRAGVWV